MNKDQTKRSANAGLARLPILLEFSEKGVYASRTLVMAAASVD